MSLYKDILNKAVTELRALDTTGVVQDASHIRRLDWSTVQKLRGVQVCWSRPQTQGTTHSRDDRGYPVHVIVCRGAKGAVTEDLDFFFDWYQKIRRHFHDKRPFSGIADSGSCLLPSRVTEGSVPESIAKEYSVQHLIITCWIRESRVNA